MGVRFFIFAATIYLTTFLGASKLGAVSEISPHFLVQIGNAESSLAGLHSNTLMHAKVPVHLKDITPLAEEIRPKTIVVEMPTSLSVNDFGIGNFKIEEIHHTSSNGEAFRDIDIFAEIQAGESPRLAKVFQARTDLKNQIQYFRFVRPPKLWIIGSPSFSESSFSRLMDDDPDESLELHQWHGRSLWKSILEKQITFPGILSPRIFREAFPLRDLEAAQSSTGEVQLKIKTSRYYGFDRRRFLWTPLPVGEEPKERPRPHIEASVYISWKAKDAKKDPFINFFHQSILLPFPEAGMPILNNAPAAHSKKCLETLKKVEKIED